MATYLADLIRDFNLDFVVIQETMKKDFSSKFLRKFDPGMLSVGSGFLRRGNREVFYVDTRIISLIWRIVLWASIL